MTTYKLLYFTTFQHEGLFKLDESNKVSISPDTSPTTATTAIAVVAPTDCRNALQKPTAMIAVPFSHHCRRALPPEKKLYSTLPSSKISQKVPMSV